jgi:hypothetical protein
MPQSAIIPSYLYRALFSRIMIVFREGCRKTIPIIRRYPGNSLSPFFLSSFSIFGGFQVPFPPYSEPPVQRYNLPTFPVIRVYKPYFVLLPRIRPKLACFKAVIAALFRFYPVFCRCKRF